MESDPRFVHGSPRSSEILRSKLISPRKGKVMQLTALRTTMRVSLTMGCRALIGLYKALAFGTSGVRASPNFSEA